jgi:hypothetical protein
VEPCLHDRFTSDGGQQALEMDHPTSDGRVIDSVTIRQGGGTPAFELLRSLGATPTPAPRTAFGQFHSRAGSSRRSRIAHPSDRRERPDCVPPTPVTSHRTWPDQNSTSPLVRKQRSLAPILMKPRYAGVCLLRVDASFISAYRGRSTTTSQGGEDARMHSFFWRNRSRTRRSGGRFCRGSMFERQRWGSHRWWRLGHWCDR